MNKLAGGSVKAIINVLWAGLIHENDKLTQKEVGKMFDLSEIQTIGEVINQAITNAVPVQEVAKSKNVQSPIQ